MPSPNEYTRQRSTQEKLQKHGLNPRKIQWNEYGPVKVRVAYLCDMLFAGDYHEMGLAMGVCYRHLYRILKGHSNLSIRLAGQIVARLGVRAEWLLCGAGPVFPWPDQTEYYSYLPQIRSCYYPIDTMETTTGTHFVSPVLPDQHADIPPEHQKYFEAAARSIFQARTNNKPVLFFLDAAIFTETAPDVIREFFEKRYANMLVATLAATRMDLSRSAAPVPTDINTLAITAAAAGAGYGETFCMEGFRSPEVRKRSLLASVFDLSAPVFISAELGEIVNHTSPAVRAPELGAAIGAAAYVDLLAFTKQVPNFFGEPGGVFIACGQNTRRAVELFLARLPPLAETYPDQKGFVFVLFEDPDSFDRSLHDMIHSHGGSVIYVSNPTVTGITRLLHTCNDAYAGTLTTP
jgi:hypothetical protein